MKKLFLLLVVCFSILPVCAQDYNPAQVYRAEWKDPVFTPAPALVVVKPRRHGLLHHVVEYAKDKVNEVKGEIRDLAWSIAISTI